MGEGLSLTPRVLDTLDVIAASVLQRREHDRDHVALHDVLVDVSQSLLRPTMSSARGVAPCLTSSSVLYSYGHDRVVLPDELARMQGFGSIIWPSACTQRDEKRMLGSGMSLPCVGSILLALHIMKTRSSAAAAV